MSNSYPPGRGISSQSYNAPLRKPGQPRQNSAQDGVALNSNAAEATKPLPMTLNVNAKEFVPRFTVPVKPQEPASQPPDQEVVDYVKESLDKLTYSPGEFDLVVDDLALAWKARIHDVSTLNEVARVIIEQSIIQTNFTYTGARLCDLIARRKELNDIQDVSKTFRTIFLTRCSEEHSRREDLLQNPSTVPRVHGFAMFLAELFSTFRFEEKPDQPLEILGTKLLEMLITLIKHRTDDSLLYAGRILKLTGCLLEDPGLIKQEGQDKLTEIFNEIQAIIEPTSPHGRSIKVFLGSVVTLRANNWGRETSPVPVTNTTTSTLSADAPPFQFPYSSTLDPMQYPDEQDAYYTDELLDYYEDITPVYNPDQWNEYCEDDSEPDDNYYQNDNYENGDEDEDFTEEMRKDFDNFMLEQQHQPPGS